MDYGQLQPVQLLMHIVLCLPRVLFLMVIANETACYLLKDFLSVKWIGSLHVCIE